MAPCTYESLRSYLRFYYAPAPPIFVLGFSNRRNLCLDVIYYVDALSQPLLQCVSQANPCSKESTLFSGFTSLSPLWCGLFKANNFLYSAPHVCVRCWKGKWDPFSTVTMLNGSHLCKRRAVSREVFLKNQFFDSTLFFIWALMSSDQERVESDY